MYVHRWLHRIIPLLSLSFIYSFYPLIHCNVFVLLFIDVNIINSGLNNIVKGEFPSLVFFNFTFYIFVISPDSWNFRPKCVTYIRNKWMLEHVCCCISLITIEDFNLINTRGWLYWRLVQEDMIPCLSSPFFSDYTDWAIPPSICQDKSVHEHVAYFSVRWNSFMSVRWLMIYWNVVRLCLLCMKKELRPFWKKGCFFNAIHEY